MIGEYTLKMLCEKYGLNSDKLIKNNSNILEYGEYIEIDKTLNYLINKLKISVAYIEKCPSILYRNVSAIESNVTFLRDTNVYFKDIESCLHVLSSEPFELKMTYEYVKNNYGVDIINKLTSILSVPKNIIIDVEKLNIPFINKNGNLSVSVGIEWGSTNLEEIQKIIQSPEFKEHPEMFTSTTLAHAKLEEIQKIIQSPEFKEHPELFTSQTLAHARLEEIQKIIQSPEFKEHPELFTSETLAHAKLEEIQKIIQSPEFKEHPELFTSQTLAHAKLDEIQELLQMDCWNDKRYSSLLTSSIVAKSKSMISKLPLLFRLAEKSNIDNFLNTSFLLFSPSQNYALIQYLKKNNLPLIIDGKLNPIFGKQPGLLKKKYNIDIKELIQKYPYKENEVNEINGGIIRWI